MRNSQLYYYYAIEINIGNLIEQGFANIADISGGMNQ